MNCTEFLSKINRLLPICSAHNYDFISVFRVLFMIAGVGVDIVSVERMAKISQRLEMRFLTRIFTPEEIAVCHGRKGRAASEAFAGRFAVKEAFKKALTAAGRDLHLDWKDVSVQNEPNGLPVLRFSPRIQSRVGDLRWHVSLSHEHQFAVAVVICEEISRE